MRFMNQQAIDTLQNAVHLGQTLSKEIGKGWLCENNYRPCHFKSSTGLALIKSKIFLMFIRSILDRKNTCSQDILD